MPISRVCRTWRCLPGRRENVKETSGARDLGEIRSARADWQAGERFGEVRAYRGARLDAPELAGRLRAS